MPGTEAFASENAHHPQMYLVPLIWPFCTCDPDWTTLIYKPDIDIPKVYLDTKHEAYSLSKVVPFSYLITSIGLGADPAVLAVSLHVT